MIRRIISHRWIRPRYSSVLLEITPLAEDGFATIAFNGKEPSSTPKSISISSATSEAGPYSLIIEGLELVDRTMRMLIPLASNARFLRFDLFGTVLPVEGIVKHQVYITVDAARGGAHITDNAATAVASRDDGVVDMHAWLGLSPGVGAPHQDQSGGAREEWCSVNSRTPRYVEARTVTELAEQVRQQREELMEKEKRLHEEQHKLSLAMTAMKGKLEVEHAKQQQRSGLYHRERERLICCLRPNLLTPDVNATCTGLQSPSRRSSGGHGPYFQRPSY